MFWRNVALGSIPDIVIAVILAYVFDGGIAGFLVALVLLQALYFAIWVKNTIWAWAMFKLNTRKNLVSHFTDYLRVNKYPEPDDFEKSAEGYLSRVISDEELPTELRLEAATCLAELNYLSTLGQIQKAAMLSIVYEEALENHKRSFSTVGRP
jgi:hypothetical protein